MMDLVFATNNAHKLAEVQSIVGDRFRIRSLAEIGCDADIPETGDTFEENAAQKTQYIIEHYGLDCFGDDSGLEVMALGNEPGVRSARYADTRDMDENIDLLLRKLGDHPDRRARFRTVISMRVGGQHHFFDGTIEGTIGHARKGSGGFGYDPIFTPLGADRTFAEMTAEEKNAISHRAIATQKLTDFLRALAMQG